MDKPADLRSDERKEIDDVRHLAVARAVAAERERCAKIAEQEARRLTNGGAINACRAIAAAIRRKV